MEYRAHHGPLEPARENFCNQGVPSNDSVVTRYQQSFISEASQGFDEIGVWHLEHRVESRDGAVATQCHAGDEYRLGAIG